MREITDKKMLELLCSYIPKKKQAPRDDPNMSMEE